jgi:hypothetical protein
VSVQQLRSTRRPEWAALPFLRTGAELTLGLSFFATMAFAALGAAEQHVSILAEISGLVFVCSLTCVLVNWFAAAPEPPRGWE